MSKHQAADEQPQASDISWIQALSKPADAAPTDTLPFYGALVAHAPRHYAPGEQPADVESPAATTGPMARISADQIDRLISHLDADPADETLIPGAPADVVVPEEIPADEVDVAPTRWCPTRWCPTRWCPTR